VYVYVVAIAVLVVLIAATEWAIRASRRARTANPASAAPVGPAEFEPEDPAEESGPQKIVFVSAVGLTDVGLKRQHNEDAFAVLQDQNFFAVADGMGREAGGEIASKLAIEAITEAIQTRKFVDPREPGWRRKRLVRVIEHANDVLRSVKTEVDALDRMGTTVVAALFSPTLNRAFIASVGDSRCYRIRRESMAQLTTDHTLGALGIQGSNGSKLSRAVGLDPAVDVDVVVDTPEPGDVYLLCSDGLTKMVDDALILSTVRSAGDLDAAAKGLIEQARERGGRDNITTILVRVDLAQGNS
jgi:serine/threonine protein phosphatase PrpC